MWLFGVVPYRLIRWWSSARSALESSDPLQDLAGGLSAAGGFVVTLLGLVVWYLPLTLVVVTLAAWLVRETSSGSKSARAARRWLDGWEATVEGAGLARVTGEDRQGRPRLAVPRLVAVEVPGMWGCDCADCSSRSVPQGRVRLVIQPLPGDNPDRFLSPAFTQAAAGLLGRDLDVEAPPRLVTPSDVGVSPSFVVVEFRERVRWDDVADVGLPASASHPLFSATLNPPLPDHPITVPLGVDQVGQLVSLNLEAAPHTLVAGATGAGKSASVLWPVVVRLLFAGQRVWLADPNGGAEFGVAEPFVERFAVDGPQAVGLLEDLYEEMEARFAWMREQGVRTWQPQFGPRLWLVMDEVGAVLTAADREERKTLERWLATVAMKGRAAGVHLVLGIQRPSSDVFPTTLRSNVPTRVVGALPSSDDSKIATGISPSEFPEADASRLPKPGRFLLVDASGGVVEFQAWHLPDEAIARLLEISVEVRRVQAELSGGAAGSGDPFHLIDTRAAVPDDPADPV